MLKNKLFFWFGTVFGFLFLFFGSYFVLLPLIMDESFKSKLNDNRKPSWAESSLEVRFEWVITQNKIDQLILGSSRVNKFRDSKILFDQGIVNLGYTGTGIKNIYHLLDFISKKKQLKTIFIEIPYYSFLKDYEFNNAIDFLIKNHSNKIYFYFYKHAIYRNFLENYFSSMKNKKKIKIDQNKFEVKNTPNDRFKVKNIPDKRDYEHIEYISNIIDIGKKKNIKIIFFMGPYHPNWLRFNYLNQSANYENYISFLKDISKITSFYYFDVFFYKKDEQFINISHFSKVVGEEMILKIINNQADQNLITEENFPEWKKKIEALKTNIKKIK